MEEETCPGKTGSTGVDMLIPGMTAVADANGWLNVLTGDGVGTGVAAGVEGLEP